MREQPASSLFDLGERSDRRDSYRLALEHGQVALEEAPQVVVRDLSASGGSLVLPAGLELRLWGGPVVFRLGRYPPFRANIVPVRARGTGNGGLCLGVHFVNLDRRALGSLSPFLVERWLALGDPRRHEPGAALIVRREALVRRRLRQHRLANRAIRVYRGDQVLPLTLRLVEGSPLAARAEPDGAESLLATGEEYTFRICDGDSVSTFCTRVLRLAPGRVELAEPPEIHQSGFRGSRRVRLADWQVQLVLRHPQLPDHVVVRSALDVASSGLSFPLEPGRDLLAPGERIDDLTLVLPDGSLRVAAAVRSLRRVDGHHLCGLEILSHGSDEDSERWHRFVLRAGHPRLELGRRELVEAAWQAIAASGYLEELSVAMRPRAARSFRRAWSRHIDDRRVSRLLLLFKDGQPVGSMAANLLYPRTWILHHLGIDARERANDPRSFALLAREIYSGMTYVLQHMAPLEHFVLYVNACRSWNRMMYGSFLDEYPRPEHFVFDRCSAYKATPRLLPEPVDAPRVVEADHAARQLIATRLAAKLAPVEVEALCYDAATITLEAFSRQCAAIGYERQRRLFVASRGDLAVAALIAETGPDGVNIFGLLDRCWLVELEAGGLADRGVTRALLRRGLAHYASCGKDECMLLLPEELGTPDLSSVGFHLEVPLLRWLARRAVLPAYLQFVEGLLGSRRG